MSEARRSPGLAEILDLEQIDPTLFRGATVPTHLVRVFGGQVAAQALVAAGRTVEASRPVHSLHGYFLLPGNPLAPIIYEVERTRDGGSFTTRRVSAIQDGEAIFILAASFHVNEEGLEHQLPVLDEPSPEEAQPLNAVIDGASPEVREWQERTHEGFPIEIRLVDGLPFAPTGEPRSRQRIWIRSATPLGEDPLLHVCGLAYASDMLLLGAAMAPHGLDIGKIRGSSLDHAMWFHAPFRADEWLLYDQEGTWTGNGRGLARGTIFDRSGRLIATVIQEGLLRWRRDEPVP